MQEENRMRNQKQQEFIFKIFLAYSLLGTIIFIPFWTYVCYSDWVTTGGNFKWGHWLFIEAICVAGFVYLSRIAKSYGWFNFKIKKKDKSHF